MADVEKVEKNGRWWRNMNIIYGRDVIYLFLISIKLSYTGFFNSIMDL
jgi:hypothetical protein